MRINKKENGDEKDYPLKIYFFRAGKADAIIISESDRHIMIDTGEESLSKEILTYFKENNITKLDYLIITHFDKDHVGSASSIIDNIEIEHILQSNVPKDSEYYNKYLNSLKNKNMEPITISGNVNYTLGNIKITINGPDKIYDSNASNNSSLIIAMTYQKNNFLFMGDAQNARIKDYLSQNKDTYNFLKIPYHGHYLKRLKELLDITNPTYAVITSSDEESEDSETIDILKNYKVKYYLTRKGSIILKSNGTDIKVSQK